MPKEYELIRDKLEKSGKSVKKAKQEAAAIYNKQHPNNPVTRYSDRNIKQPK